jgi:hypothetical protein
MKRIFIAFLALAVSATLVFVATSWKHGITAVHAQGGCSVATLTGSYGVVVTGANAPGHSVRGRNNIPNAAVGVITFDGAGNFSDTYTIVFNGVASPASDVGTYTVNSDCSGTLTDTTINIHANLAIVGGGTEVFGILTDRGFTDTFDVKKQ